MTATQPHSQSQPQSQPQSSSADSNPGGDHRRRLSSGPGAGSGSVPNSNPIRATGFDLKSGLIFPIIVALVTLGLGGGVQFLMWGGSVSESLEQLDRRLAGLDQRLVDLYPRSEAVLSFAGVRRDIEQLFERSERVERRLDQLERR